MRVACRHSAMALAFVAAAGVAPVTLAAPLTVSQPFLQLYNSGVNSLGFSTGAHVRIGADSVVPNGNGGTTGRATTIDTDTGTSVQYDLAFLTSPVVPNLVQRTIPFHSGLLGPWDLSFTNGPDTWQRTMTLPTGTQQAPFVNSITLSGSSDRPTFSWTAPPGAQVNGYRVNIYDKSLINLDPAAGPLNTGQVASLHLAPTTTSYQVKDSDLEPGYTFQRGKQYSIEISLMQTRDGSTTNLFNSNVYAMSRVYADFTPVAGGMPAVNLPVVLANGTFQYDIAVQAGQLYYIDPEVAIGYDYEIGANDGLLFGGVLLPTDVGDGLYDIYGRDDGGALVLLAADWMGGTMFDFSEGVDWFGVRGIEVSAGLDPANTTAFVTGVTFIGSGRFTGTQTPIVVDMTAVPVPGSALLMLLGAAAMAVRLRSRVERK